MILASIVKTEKDLYFFNQKVDLFITETTHIEVENVVKILKKLNPCKLVLTHIGEDLEESLGKYLESLSEHLKSRVILTFDGLELNHFK